MSDLISRQAAIDAVSIGNLKPWLIDVLQEIIKEIPSAEKTGEWIEASDLIDNQSFSECKCSECGAVEYFNKEWKRFNYCPNCGARMGED